jgi:hypothetical protein
MCFIYKRGGPGGGEGNSKFQVPSLAPEREMKDFRSWTQTSVTQMKYRLGVGPKRQ